MEIEIIPSERNSSYLEIYVDGDLFRKVPKGYFRREIKKLKEAKDFYTLFTEIEEKKAYQYGLYLLSRRGYTKPEWVAKMKRKGFSSSATESVYENKLSQYFDEEHEVDLKVRILINSGKGPRFIHQKVGPLTTLSREEIDIIIAKHYSEENQIEKAHHLLKKKGYLEDRARAYRFLGSRGFPADVISRALAQD